MLVLDGKAVAAFHREQVVQQIGKLRDQGIVPELAIILAGDDKASAVYARAMFMVQDSVVYERRGIAVGVATLIRSIAQTLGASLFGTMINTHELWQYACR